MLNRLKKLASSSKKSLLVVAGASVLCASLISGAQAVPVYFFGDSLTDSGYADNTPVPIGKGPIYTTYGGYVWSQYVAHDFAPELYSLPNYSTGTPADKLTNNKLAATAPYTSPVVSGTKNGADYASAGSAVLGTTTIPGMAYTPPTLAAQIQYHLQTRNGVADPNGIYFIWAGSNDFLGLILNHDPNLNKDLAELASSSGVPYQLYNQVLTLINAHAKKIVVLGLPDLGVSPFAKPPASPTSIALTTASSSFNNNLGQWLNLAQAYFPGTKIYYVKIDSKVASLYNTGTYTAAGQTFTFSNVSMPACFLSTGQFAIVCPAVPPRGDSYNDYVFADSVHPSGKTGRLISLVVEQCYNSGGKIC